MDDTQRITWPTRDSRMDLWSINQFPDMDQLVGSLDVPAGVPEPTERILCTALDLFRHGFYHYEFLAVAVTWSVFAVEPMLRDRYPRGGGLQRLINRAHRDGLIDDRAKTALFEINKLRNHITHQGTAQTVLTPTMARGMIATSIAFVEHLRDAPSPPSTT